MFGGTMTKVWNVISVIWNEPFLSPLFFLFLCSCAEPMTANPLLCWCHCISRQHHDKLIHSKYKWYQEQQSSDDDGIFHHMQILWARSLSLFKILSPRPFFPFGTDERKKWRKKAIINIESCKSNIEPICCKSITFLRIYYWTGNEISPNDDGDMLVQRRKAGHAITNFFHRRKKKREKRSK